MVQVDTMALFTVVGDNDRPPTMNSAAAQLGVEIDDLDPAFGIVPIDPKQHLFAVHARADRVAAALTAKLPYQGPFASPGIATFGDAAARGDDDPK